MPRFDLKTARRAALMALGESGEQDLANLEAVGLVIVRKQDLPRESAETATHEAVRLTIDDHWQDPYDATVVSSDWDGPRTLGVEFGALESVREAAQLQRTLGYQVDIRIDERAGLITHAQAFAK